MTSEGVAQIIYFVVGLPIAWYFIRQNDMADSVDEANSSLLFSHPGNLVILLLAMLWPILLFCIGVNFLFDRSDRNSKRKKQSSADREDLDGDDAQ